MSKGCSQVLLGVGDDCAEVQVQPNHKLLVSSDALVSGRHFFADADPYDVGYKSLAVNLSDLAAMGATPLAFTLCVALGRPDGIWLKRFSEGLLSIAKEFSCPLIGGDTCAANNPDDCFVSITIFGQLPKDRNALRRSNAVVGDDLWVTGTPGLARIGLLDQSHQKGLLSRFLPDTMQNDFLDLWSHLSESSQQEARSAICRPQPRLLLGRELLGIAHSAIDLSDGLAGDLKHIMLKSDVGFELDAALLGGLWDGFGPSKFLSFCQHQSLQGGDDYELCFTSPVEVREQIEQLSAYLNIRCTRIGRAVEGGNLELRQDGAVTPIQSESYDHF